MKDSTVLNSSVANNSNQDKPPIQNNLSEYITGSSNSTLNGVFAYGIIFVVAIIGHILWLISKWKQFKVKRSRILLLLLHFSLADLIVCMVIVPTEIIWRLSVQWEVGNILCKATQYFRAFGLYLSSLILICLNVDRFISIMFPLKVVGFGAYKNIKWMIAAAWILAGLFSIPQTILFRVKFHPEFENYRQCVTSSIEDDDFELVKMYTLFSIVIMYFLPLFVIVITYSFIFVRMVIMSRVRRPTVSGLLSESDLQPSTSSSTVTYHDGSQSTSIAKSSTFHLRSNQNAQANLNKAKIRTLKMTIFIVIAFILCWTPYAVMILWYIVDREGAMKVDYRIQDTLFLMVIANSCVNPIIYGGFSQTTCWFRCFLR